MHFDLKTFGGPPLGLPDLKRHRAGCVTPQHPRIINGSDCWSVRSSVHVPPEDVYGQGRDVSGRVDSRRAVILLGMTKAAEDPFVASSLLEGAADFASVEPLFLRVTLIG
eukprot:GHVN01024502.1.p2 GENE.GHVN01024502.1~~GHVN01024502.1.p2  ORF type:complete len:110 (-),score=5.45 GHVN01024502.1:774-1103(-)